MPQVGAVRNAVLTALGVAVSEAWPGLKEVYWRPPSETVSALPYAALILRGMEADWQTVDGLSWPIFVDVFGVFPKSAGLDWAEEAVAKFDALAAQVETPGFLAGVAELPVLSEFDPSPQLDVAEGAFAVQCGFRCQVFVRWGQ